MTFPTQCSNVLQIEGALKWSWYDLQATQLQNRFFNWETLKLISKRLNTKGEVVKPQSHNSAIYDFAGGSGLPIVWRRAFAPVSPIRTFFYRTRVRSFVTHWPTHSCLVNLIGVALACEDDNSKIVGIVTVALFTIRNMLTTFWCRFGRWFGHKVKFLFILWAQGFQGLVNICCWCFMWLWSSR